MQSQLHALLALQGKDAQALEGLRRIEHLERRKAQVQDMLEQLRARNEQRHGQLEAKQLESRRLSEEVDHLADHIREQERKLDEDIVSFKEIDVIKTSILHGHEHIDQLEDKALQVLDEAETQTQRVQQEDEAFEKRNKLLEADRATIEQDIAAEQEAVKAFQQERQALWEALPEHLKAVYQQLQDSLDNPLAPLEGSNCGGCHLQISAQLSKAVRQDDALVHCEHCSRILYLP